MDYFTKKNKLIWFVCFATLLVYGCQEEYIDSSEMVEDHFFLKSGNQHMPVTVAGNISSRKFVVIIHGGPGGNGLDYRDKYTKELLEKELAVVYWDQRFAGNTQGNGGNSDITAFRSDIKNLLTLLRAKYGSEIHVYLLGHSWGGFLSPYFLVEGTNQEMVQGWIQVGGAHNYRLNDSLTREMLLYYGNLELKAGRNMEEWQEIVEWCSENGFEGRENAATLNHFAHQAESLIEEVFEPEFYFEPEQIRKIASLSHWSNGIATSLRQIDLPTYTIPISDQLFKINVPTLLLWGKYDFVCPPELAEDVEKNIGSSDVQKVIYVHAGHSPMVNEPELFWNQVVRWVKAR